MSKLTRYFFWGIFLACFTTLLSVAVIPLVCHLASRNNKGTVLPFDATIQAQSEIDAAELFSAPDLLELCEVISKHDHSSLERLLSQPRDLNLTGKAGLSVLHWAFIANDLEAFERLLKAGASPDIVHTDNFVQGSIGFLKGSTFPLDCLQYGREKLAFFDATLPYLQSPNHRSPATDQTILHAYIYHCFTGSGPAIEDIIRRIMITGVDPSIQDFRSRTAAELALGVNMFDACLFILEASKDSSRAKATQDSIRELLDEKLRSPPLALNGRIISEEAQVVKFWMDENAPLPSEP